MLGGVFDLAIIVLIAAGLSLIAKFLKQPLILAYILAGVLVTYLGFLNINIENTETFHIFSNLGIMFLLFLVGLEINYSSLRLVGKPSLIIGLGQIVFTAGLGFLLALGFNIDYLPAAYISIALTFSSTIVIVKFLSDKKDINSLYGKISIGFLLVQDLVAVLILVVLSGIDQGVGIDWLGLLGTILKGAILFAAMMWFGRKALPYLFDKIARSQELLFLISLMWVFLVAAIVTKMGFSIEIAGFLAGLALAKSSENHQIASKIKPLRDFFIVIFFVVLGSTLILSNLGGLTWPILAFSLFVLIGNPLIVLIIMGLMGYRKRTSFFAGVTVAQISEFSLVIAALGLKLGHIDSSMVALITAVGVITITLSSYMIAYSHEIFKRLSNFLRMFEREDLVMKDAREKVSRKEIVLIGCNRVGESIARFLNKRDLLVVDFDPDVVEKLKKEGFEYIFGDMNDEEVFDKVHKAGAKLIISTSPDLEDNLAFLERIKLFSKAKSRVVFRAETDAELEILYQKGADYVLFPHITSGEYLGKALSKNTGITQAIKDLKGKNKALLKF